MNAHQDHPMQANLQPAAPATAPVYGDAMTPKQKREYEDTQHWIDEQEEAELELLVSEMANRDRREWRMSAYG